MSNKKYGEVAKVGAFKDTTITYVYENYYMSVLYINEVIDKTIKPKSIIYKRPSYMTNNGGGYKATSSFCLNIE